MLGLEMVRRAGHRCAARFCKYPNKSAPLVAAIVMMGVLCGGTTVRWIAM